MSYSVEEVADPAGYDEAGVLITEYLRSLPFEVTFQDIEAELAALPSRYGPPAGAAFLARSPVGQAVGVVCLRSLGPGTGEVKRMYVTPRHRGTSLGRMLMQAVIARSGGLGFARLRLDTVRSLARANALYEELGFVDIPPYNDNPLADARFMELRLG